MKFLKVLLGFLFAFAVVSCGQLTTTISNTTTTNANTNVSDTSNTNDTSALSSDSIIESISSEIKAVFINE